MTTKQKAQTLYEKVTAINLGCVGEDGYPLTKAVVPGKYRDSLDEMFFATNTSSSFAGAVAKNPKASVYFYEQEPTRWQGCYLKGEMEIVTDMATKEKYWIEKFKDAYAEKSFTDPDFCLLRFIPKRGRLYANYNVDDFDL